MAQGYFQPGTGGRFFILELLASILLELTLFHLPP